MSSSASGGERHVKTLRVWQLAILRFAVTLDNADRLAVLAIAAEIDELGPKQDSKPDFRFFRKTSTELCAAILRPDQLTSTILRQHLARIDDDRLQHLFAVAMEEAKEKAHQPKASSVSEHIKRGSGLWRGFSSRGNHPL
jgi:hypothetical protein